MSAPLLREAKRALRLTALESPPPDWLKSMGGGGGPGGGGGAAPPQGALGAPEAEATGPCKTYKVTIDLHSKKAERFTKPAAE